MLVGVSVSHLKRLDPAKESRDFNLDFVPPDLEFVPLGLDFVPKNLDFLHPAGGARPSTLMTHSATESSAAETPQIRPSISLPVISIPIRQSGDKRKLVLLDGTAHVRNNFKIYFILTRATQSTSLSAMTIFPS